MEIMLVSVLFSSERELNATSTRPITININDKGCLIIMLNSSRINNF